MSQQSNIEIQGCLGVYVNDSSVISFQLGEGSMQDALQRNRTVSVNPVVLEGQVRWLTVKEYNIASRGWNNLKCQEVASDIKHNRLLPRLITKQVNMLYGSGPAVYKTELVDNKVKRTWIMEPSIQRWLESWEQNGMEQGYRAFAKQNIKNYYYFRDFFVKWRFSAGKGIVPGVLPVAGLEAMENKDCLLATTRTDVAYDMVYYKDFTAIAVGKFINGISTSLRIYPKLRMQDVPRYRFAAVSHHREKSIDNFYGENETHEGTQPYIKGSNENAIYINSFLRNSLAAKIHIIIPNAWVNSKRTQITNLCNENKERASKQEKLLLYNGLEIGTEFKESTLIRYIKQELDNISDYLSGADNQGKAYATFSFRNGSSGEEERWKIETVDLKYKEYIDAIISYDKRADEVLLSSVGLDSSISSVSKDGVISKSGSDAYYNYLIYLLQLAPEDEIVCEPFNQAIRINFPELYEQGYRIGFYREIPSRQEDVSPSNRLNNQQP